MKHISELREIIPDDFHIFIDTFQALNDVKKSCFGFTLGENFSEKIKVMEEKWTQLKEKFNVSIPNKCHIIFDHLEEFIIRKNRPLGEFSEQVVEASHQKLKQIWEWYIVKDLESESHGENLLKCINHFNSFNVWSLYC